MVIIFVGLFSYACKIIKKNHLPSLGLLILRPMLKNHIIALLSGNKGFELTESQQILAEKLAHFIVLGREDTVFMIRGYA